ncbi:hypothetical protein ASN_1182 [Acetobacter senegalensis]|uniref:Peptidase A2 domain-containing protein n=1 Tax=Acetobacter senegalensis TaxID=446692 RepID=A0A0U5ESG4_9PROT|nr:retroviral-like aspartic protease family protein [Acetobacter senegalensis]CEF40553.1 hypothetical protein ASN_1182 [Acetobacter senegalensis]
MKQTLRAVYLALMASVAGCAQTPAGCQVATLGTLPVLNATGSPIVEVTLNGQKAAMIVDTGASVSMVSRKAAHDYKLTALSGDVSIQGVGGLVQSSLFQVPSMGLGSAKARNVVLVDTPRVFGYINTVPVVGLFGGDFLKAYEVVFDLPAHTINLYQTNGCSSPTPMWDGPVSSLSFQRIGRSHIEVPLELNGHKIDAVLDSGSSMTVILPRQAHHAGVHEEQLKTDVSFPSRGIDRNVLQVRLHRFEQLKIGEEVFINPVLAVGAMQTEGEALLGADFLRHNRVWVSNQNEKIYIQRLVPPPRKDPTFEPEMMQP